ncbi:hypothetical protein A8145_24800 [Mesorhizobium loti]|uniref:Uncharacterized protein n=1 Tax=Rhizobium loti TaxID=381 RepID=A0AA91J0G3_RHILI|nr:hypothetical protein A8145_24800 [Mesorhizobium loti]
MIYVLHHVERHRDIKAAIIKSQIFEILVADPLVHRAKWLVREVLRRNVVSCVTFHDHRYAPAYGRRLMDMQTPPVGSLLVEDERQCSFPWD